MDQVDDLNRRSRELIESFAARDKLLSRIAAWLVFAGALLWAILWALGKP